MASSLPVPVDPAQEIRIHLEDLRSVTEKLLVKNSMFQFDAKVAAQRIIEADLYGVPSHGAAQLLRILTAMDCGDIDPRGRVLTLSDAPCFAMLDGSRTVGAVAATKGAELAIAKAAEQGVGVVTVGNSQTLGSAGVYVRLATTAGMIGICMTSTGGASVTALGSNLGGVGNCGFAYGVPVMESHPLIFDSACGEDSWSKLRLLQRYGVPMPDGLLFDEQGEPTTDLSHAAAVRPKGDALGFGLSMLTSVLAGPLCNGWLPMHKKRRIDSEDSQHFFLMLDPSKFCNVEKFSAQLKTTLNEIRELDPIDLTVPVRIPGDRGAACYADAMEYGIPLHQSVAQEIKELATRKNIPVTW